MKILFLIPPSVGDFFTAQIPHTGIAYLSAFIKRETDAEVKIIDMRLGYSKNDVFKVIDSFNPDIVGISLFSYGFEESRTIVNEISDYKNSYRVVIGGPHVSAAMKFSLMDTKANFAVFGEGEFTFLELCKSLEKNSKDFSHIKGLIWRKGNQILENDKREFIKDLNSLPFPDYKSFELEKYLCYTEKHLPIVTSRGCPYCCVYCSVRLSMGQNFRFRSAENVVEEIKYWYGNGWISFDFADDAFNSNMDRAKKICDLIIQNNIKIKWKVNNGIRADRVDRELLEKMKKSGCVYIAYGVESANNKVLAAMKKAITIEQIKKSIELTKEVGITLGITFIIGGPEETFEDFKNSYNFAKSVPVDNINFYNMIPYPHTEMFEWVEKNGRFLKNKDTYLYNIAHWKNEPIFETKEFPENERKRAFIMAYEIHRKKVLQLKLGNFMGSFVWIFVRNKTVDDMLRRAVLRPGIIRKIFNKLKRE